MFRSTLDRVLAWSKHPRAPIYLGAVSFAESSFFPIPPDVILAPLVLARPERAWRLAAWTTVWSVLGGVAAFVVASYAVDLVSATVMRLGYGESYALARGWFSTWGFWAVIVAGFSPVPYKLFALAAGAMSMFLPGFIAASIIGRGGRFFLVAGLVAFGGAPMLATLRRFVDRAGWGVVAAGLVALAIYRFA